VLLNFYKHEIFIQHVRAGRIEAAIRLLRDQVGYGELEAKELVRMAQMRLNIPEDKR
jgi:hypothetical protein